MVHVGDGGSVVLAQLSWGTEDGAQFAVGFSPDMAGCYGHHRTARGDVVQVRGELDGRRVYPAGAGGARGHEFDAEAEEAGGWHPAGRLRVLVDDGGDAPVRWADWRDRSGNACSVALRSVIPSGNADVTGLVSAVRATGEYRRAGEVAANLVDASASKWLVDHNRASLEFQLAQPVAVDRYVLTSANDAPDRDPATWTLCGSADGHSWRALDIRSGQSFARRHQSRTYRIAEPGAYEHYRLDITGTNGSPHLQLEAVRFLADGSAGFAGYRQRAGQEPVAYRGIRVAQASPGMPAEPLPGLAMAMIPSTDEMPVIRTDFSDPQAWGAVRAAIRTPLGQAAGAAAAGPAVTAHVEFIDDPRFQGLSSEQLLALAPQEAAERHACLFVVDEAALAGADRPVLVVGLGENRGRTFRSIATELFEIENNLSIGNMDFEEFADAADADGVFRGFGGPPLAQVLQALHGAAQARRPEMVEPYGGGTGFRFKIRNVKIDGQGDAVHVRGGGSHELSFDVLHDCRECGNAVNQVIVGLAGQDRAQASVWNGKQRSGGGLKVVNPGIDVEALAEDNPGPAEWVNVSCDIVVPDEPGTYSVRARYAQAYQGRLMTAEGRTIPQPEYLDVLGWWKVDRPDGPGPESAIGTIIVES
jgi:hypothetical protein